MPKHPVSPKGALQRFGLEAAIPRSSHLKKQSSKKQPSVGAAIPRSSYLRSSHLKEQPSEKATVRETVKILLIYNSITKNIIKNIKIIIIKNFSQSHKKKKKFV